MKIAILAWGSLLWDRGGLKIKTREKGQKGVTPRYDWLKGGPKLPLEFSRISKTKKGILTLVIDPINGAFNPSWYAISARTNLDQAISELAKREKTIEINIGYVRKNKKQRSRNQKITKTIRQWLEDHDFDAAIWTDLPPNFETELGKKFAVTDAISYLNGLSEEIQEEAKRYFSHVPSEIKTPLRQTYQMVSWLHL